MSSRHPLGFTKITLAAVFGYRARLHIWHTGGSDKPHDHRWPFIGIPLIGTFTDTRWTRRPGTAHRAVATTPPTRGSERHYRLTGDSARLERDAVWIRRPLVPYRCRVGEIHTFAPRGRGPHVSLALLGRRRSATSTVWEDA